MIALAVFAIAATALFGTTVCLRRITAESTRLIACVDSLRTGITPGLTRLEQASSQTAVRRPSAGH